MSDLAPTPCVACGSREYTVIIQDSLHHRQTVRCTNCKLIYILPAWTAQTAQQHFAERSKWPGGLHSTNTTNRQPGMQFIARQIAARLPEGGRLLDIGCADGKFFNTMRQETNKWQFYGAEPDATWDGLDYKGAQVIFRPLRQCSFQDEEFDVVSILDALYYLPDPDKELAEIGRILKPGGLLVFDTAGLAYLQLRGLVGTIVDLDRTRTFAAYPFYYSIPSVQALLTKTGFIVDALLVDQGIEHRSAALRIAMPIYMSMVKLATLLFPVAHSLAPKLVYVARRL